MTDTSTRASWLVYALGLLCAGAIVAAILVVGPASGSQATVTRTATVAQGVVQSTVSGTGNLHAASQLNLGFKAGGTVTHVYVTQGQRVVQGQLLATLDPQSAEVTLEQAKATLQSAEANLAKEEETEGESASGSSTGGGAASSTATAAAVLESSRPVAALAAARTAATTTPTSTTSPPPTTTPTSTSTTPSTTTSRPTAPGATAPSTSTPRKGAKTKPETTKQATTTTTSSTSTPKATVSAATREANIASAKAAVKSDRLTVHSDEQAVQDTKLYAPEDGTIVSLSGQVGEVVSGSGTTRASASSSGSSGSGATGSGAAAASGRSATGSSSSSASSGASSSTSSPFAVLSDLSSMELVAPLSESEIGNVKAGQIATVTVEALEGRKVAAHVREVAILSTSNSGVVSYDVTFQLDQMERGLRPGMSATAEVVVKQAEGVNVPTTAITAGTVTVVRAGKHVRQRVVTGLAGNSSTIVLSGLKAGETIVLPTTGTSTRSSTTSGLRRALGGGAAGGLGGLGSGAGPGLFRVGGG
jgi:multidrug efflux pump subunit AcrA (membrane-fusion protein)